jgi:xeroderma pigmentosum group C-complementing protein
MNDERVEVEQQARSLEAIRLWRRFFAGLQIRERVQGYEIEGEDRPEIPLSPQLEETPISVGGGGFIPDQDEMEIAQPTAGNFFRPENEMDKERGREEGSRGGFIPEGIDEEQEQQSLRRYERGLEFSTTAVAKHHNQQPRVRPYQSPERGRYHLEVCSSVIEDSSDVEMEEGFPDQGKERTKTDHGHPRSGHGILPTKVHNAEERALGQPADKTRHTHKLDIESSTTEWLEIAEDSMRVDSESDSLSKGSLLSHDPEDDEADPEWLYD